MHRALKAFFLIALMLGYVLPQSGRTETFCMISLDVCECDSFQACPSLESHTCCDSTTRESPAPAQTREGATEAPCCFDLSEALDWFVVLEGVRAMDAALIAPVLYPEIGSVFIPSQESAIVRIPDPPPLQREGFRFLQCERILV